MIFLELGKMQFNIWGVAYNPVPWIENIDSINNFFDIEHVIQEAANETDFKKLRFYLNTPVTNLHFGVHELLMSGFENLGKWGSTLGKQYLRVSCPKGKLEYKCFSSPVQLCN